MGILAKIIAELGLKLLTSSVVSQVLIYTMNELAIKTDGKLDDKIVKTVADALGVKID